MVMLAEMRVLRYRPSASCTFQSNRFIQFSLISSVDQKTDHKMKYIWIKKRIRFVHLFYSIHREDRRFKKSVYFDHNLEILILSPTTHKVDFIISNQIGWMFVLTLIDNCVSNETLRFSFCFKHQIRCHVNIFSYLNRINGKCPQSRNYKK